MASGFPFLAEDGVTVCDPLTGLAINPGLPPGSEQSSTSEDVAHTGTGMHGGCCHLRVNTNGEERNQEPDARGIEERRYVVSEDTR